MHETSWQLELRVHDGDFESFAALMRHYDIGLLGEEIASHGYVWSTTADGQGVAIAKAADKTATPTVTWSADWPSARQAFTQIGPSFATDLLAIAEPLNLVTYGDGEPETADGSVVDVATAVRRPTRPRNAGRKRVVVHGHASLQLANG